MQNICALTSLHSRKILCALVLLIGAAMGSTAVSAPNAAPYSQSHLLLADLSLSNDRTANEANRSSSAKTPAAAAKPLWDELTPAQKDTLSPLAIEWNSFNATQKKKWLAISNKYPSMTPIEKIRLQEQMRDWVKLTPAQRKTARESYSRAKKLDAGQKSTEWEQYQKLPEEQKKKLAEEAAAKKRVANLPPPSQGKVKIEPVPAK